MTLKVTELIALNVSIEREITPAGDLIPLPGKDRVLLSVYRHADGCAAYFYRDVPAALRAQITALGPERMLGDPATVRTILSRFAPCDNVMEGTGGAFARTPSPEEFPDVVVQNGSYVILVDGVPVSSAWTQDGSERACELAVETLPEFRRRGFARQVVAAWARDVIESGKVAFYSYLKGNGPSEALARNLGVVLYATWITYF